MNTSLTDRYKHHRFPAEIISHGVWLYYRFCLSYRDVEELLFVRGVTVSYEAIRKWGKTRLAAIRCKRSTINFRLWF
jgi:putative transposase